MSTVMTEERPVVVEPLLNPVTALEAILAAQSATGIGPVLHAFGAAFRGGLTEMTVYCQVHRQEMTLGQLLTHVALRGRWREPHPPGSVEVVAPPGVSERERARMGERWPP